MKDDAISRRAAIEAANGWFRLYEINRTMSNATSIQDILQQLPSAQPEIIRCKDCKHYLRPHGCGYIDGMVTAQEDGFCSFAERRTDDLG